MADRRDPEITDLRRYRKDRERAKKAQARARRPDGGAGESLLGGRPRAGLILLLVLIVLAGLWALQLVGRGGLAPGASHAQIPPARGGNP